MHMMIRRYKMTGNMDELLGKVAAQFGTQLSPNDPDDQSELTNAVRVPAGIVSYQAVVTGPDTLLTVTVFDSVDSFDRAQPAAAQIRHSLSEFRVDEVETISGDVAISHAAEHELTGDELRRRVDGVRGRREWR